MLLDRAPGPRSEDRGTDGQADPARLLFAFNQNLRFAADAAELGRQVLAELDGVTQ